VTAILGLGGYSHDASAALLRDGELVAAVQEERLTRIKHQGGFPYESIRYCLKAGGVTADDVAAIAFYTRKSNWDGYLLDVLARSLRHFRYTATHRRGFVASVGYRVQRSLNFRADLGRFFHETGFSPRKFFDYDHHACHAASAYYASPFDGAVVLCIDGGGDGKSTTGWIGRGRELRELELGIRVPHSLGLLYTRITRYLGFPGSGDEYKVMGLAAYGKPTYVDRLRKLVVLTERGYRLEMGYFNYQYAYALADRFYAEFGPPRTKGGEITAHYADMAASAQQLFEEIVLHLAVGLKRRTGLRALAVAGGSSLNCTANGMLLRSGEFDSIFVPPAASDLGTSLGAALYHWHQVRGRPRGFRLTTDAWGPAYGDDEVRAELERASIPYERLDDPAATAAELLAGGEIVGWFQGRMEFGPRALGQRSILADPRRREIKDRVNRTIKFREEFRPFAPSCLREYAPKYFDVDVDTPFMTFTVGVLPARRDEIPGVVHVDGSARLQTVTREDDPLYHALLSRFHELTGVPLVLNTSFNLAGEPIVCSPFDALRTFFTCGMDALVIGRFLVRKSRWRD
jgi:carbamoyltransferase